MAIILSHQSALDCLQHPRFDKGLNTYEIPNRIAKEKASGSRDIEARAVSRFLYGDDRGVHVLVERNVSRRDTRYRKKHSTGFSLPENSFLRFDESLYICRPELALLQMAGKENLLDIIFSVSQTCSLYALDASEPWGVRSRSQATSKEAIAAYAEAIAELTSAKIIGVGQLKSALRYAVEGAASPREAEMALLLCLPERLGGYGLPRAELNGEPRFSSGKFEGAHEVRRCDLIWKERHVAVEYESNACHKGAEKIANDSQRRAVLRARGFEVLTVTNGQIENPREFYVVAKALSDALGVRFRKKGQEWAQRHMVLRRSLHLHNSAACLL